MRYRNAAAKDRGERKEPFERSARQHAHLFARRLLRDLVFADSDGLFLMLARNPPAQLLNLWNLVAQDVRQPIALSAEAFSAARFSYGDWGGRLIIFPTPLGITEPWFAIIVRKLSDQFKWISRYFLVERRGRQALER